MKSCLGMVNGLETQISSHAPTPPMVAHSDLAFFKPPALSNARIKKATFTRTKIFRYALSNGFSLVT